MKICQICGVYPANVQINSQEGVISLCSECALNRLRQDKDQQSTQQQQKQGSPATPIIMAVIPMVSSIASRHENIPDISCKKCGSSLKEYIADARFTCPDCYEAFSDIIKQQLTPIVRNVKHIGKFPARTFKYIRTIKLIEKLREQLDSEIKKENYEIAARLRDTIKNLEDEVEKFSG